MCGILGQVSWNKPIVIDVFERMLLTLKQRGPDGAGIQNLDNSYAMLGHTRLSIIDLSNAGKQPMSNEDGSVWLTFNGEIYNFRALRDELEKKGHIFKSNTDSESILHAYEEWGVACVNRLRGIFAFGIYDCRNRSLFMARDPIGVKPLFYHTCTDGFIFASQPRAILEASNFKKSVDHKALSFYLAYGNVPAEHCIYSSIKKLKPGHWLLLQDGQITVRQYWTLNYKPVIKDFKEARNVIRNKIEDCIKAQSVSDVSIGTLLSGGVDSTIITSLLASQGGSEFPTFTVGFNEQESDERQFARLVAEAFNTRHRERLLTYPIACSLIQEIVEAYDEPFHFNGLFPYYALSQLVQSEKIKVVLGGDGADELFAGYLWYEHFLKEWNCPDDKNWLSEALLFLSKSSKKIPKAVEVFFRYNGYLNPTVQKKLAGFLIKDIDFTDIYQPLAQHWNADYSPVLAAQMMDFNCFLVDHCLTKVDRASMACGVEVRVPFLDVELVDLIFSIDHELIFHANHRKTLLKQAMAHALPTQLDIRRKKGFSSPVNFWLEQGLASAGEPLLINGGLCSYGYLNPKAIRMYYSRLRPSDQLLLISVELWFLRWIENCTSVCKDFVQRAQAHLCKGQSDQYLCVQ